MDNGLSPPAGELILLSVEVVLILIVMDNGLSPWQSLVYTYQRRVLILIVMDNGLSL